MKEDLSDFAKYIIDNNLARPLSEAFEEFPVEEEYHKGKVEYFLREHVVEYHRYKAGDIVFVKEYLYEDGSKGNNHFFVIIDNVNFIVPIEYFSMIISSNIKKESYTNKLLEKDSINNLDRDSIVKTDAVYIISENDISFKLGEVEPDMVEKYKELYLKFKNN